MDSSVYGSPTAYKQAMMTIKGYQYRIVGYH